MPEVDETGVADGRPGSGVLEGFAAYLLHERGLSGNTVRAYLQDVGDYLRWCERAGVQPLDTDHRAFRRYLAELDRARYSRRTVNRRLSSLRTCYGWLVPTGQAKSDPTAVIVSPKQPKALPRRISSADLDKLLTVSDLSTPQGLRDQAMLELMYASGARIGEMAGLRVSSVSFPARQVTLMGKGSKQRIVPLHPLALDTLVRYLADGRPQLVGPASGDALFLSSRGNPMSADALRKAFKRCCTAAGLPADIHPHDMRHTFATDLVENGADLRSVQELLGHSSLSTTQIYTHLSTAHLKDEHHQAHPRG